MRVKNKKNGGFLLTELSVSLSLLAILLITFAISLNVFRRFNDYQLARQRCISAAQAQIESIAATGREISDEDFKRLWPKLSVTIEKTKGSGQWEGMTFAMVTAKTKSFNKEVKIQMSRYILPGTDQ